MIKYHTHLEINGKRITAKTGNNTEMISFFMIQCQITPSKSSHCIHFSCTRSESEKTQHVSIYSCSKVFVVYWCFFLYRSSDELYPANAKILLADVLRGFGHLHLVNVKLVMLTTLYLRNYSKESAEIFKSNSLYIFTALGFLRQTTKKISKIKIKKFIKK